MSLSTNITTVVHNEESPFRMRVGDETIQWEEGKVIDNTLKLLNPSFSIRFSHLCWIHHLRMRFGIGVEVQNFSL